MSAKLLEALQSDFYDLGLGSKAELWQFWSWCIFQAARSGEQQIVFNQVVDLMPGEFVFTVNLASKELKLSTRQVRGFIVTLLGLQKIGKKTTNKFSVLSIINWDTYMDEKIEKGKQRANKGQTKQADEVNGKGAEEFYLTRKKRKLSGKRLETFERFWEAFNYKAGKAEAADAWMDIPQLTNKLVDQIVMAAEKEAQKRPAVRASGRTPKMAQGWISGKRWEDYEEEEQPTPVNVDLKDPFIGLPSDEEMKRMRSEFGRDIG